jgi:hypothetical protein
MGTIRQDVKDIRIHVRRLFDPPVHVQYEVAELVSGPETLVAFTFAFCVVINDAVENLPMTVVALGDFPVGEVTPIEQRSEARRRLVVRGVRCCR